ncbi:hypothetical protein A2U01_0109083, partial [Trifolium medium]|nr:hypothetical protein [Trifolium medium]
YKPILAPQAIKTNIKNVPCPDVVAQRAVALASPGEHWRALASTGSAS